MSTLATSTLSMGNERRLGITKTCSAYVQELDGVLEKNEVDFFPKQCVGKERPPLGVAV
jgi:hypothetical protein